jgi:hypothetical protein
VRSVKADRHLVMGLIVQARPTTMNVKTCAGCAAASQKLLASEQITLCKAMPPCFAGGREDGLNVVWAAVAVQP